MYQYQNQKQQFNQLNEDSPANESPLSLSNPETESSPVLVPSPSIKKPNGANLETERLLLRMFTLDDLDDLAKILGNANVMKFLGIDCKPISRKVTKTALKSIIAHWEVNGFGRLAIVHKETDTLIGWSGLRCFDGFAELVYLIDEKYWGQGLATEIASACVNCGFTNHGFERIIAFARPENIASRRVMEKIGMSFVQEVTVFGVFVVQYEIELKNYLSE
jgi:ribosomal-protein-alanine N-acetyltransferase